MTDNKTAVVTQQEKNISDSVLNKIQAMDKDGGISFPANYSYQNAIKQAWLILQETVDKDRKPVLETCTKPSICNTLLDMVIQGLNPVKKQCYFIAYGNKLQLMRSYMGTMAVTKRVPGVKNVYANIIYEGDEFEYVIDFTTGLKKITKHTQSFESIDNEKIKGAYAVVVTDTDNFVEIMNISQIQQCWRQSKMGVFDDKGGLNPKATHSKFTDEMCKKTVINRACKLFLNTSDDSDLVITRAFNNTVDDGEPMETDVITAEYEVKEEVKEKAASKPLEMDVPVETPTASATPRTRNQQPQQQAAKAPF